MTNEALAAFKRDFAECVFPHRAELHSIIESGQSYKFSSVWPSPLDCAHYASIWADRAHRARRAASADFAEQCQEVVNELSRTPTLPCRLFTCSIKGKVIAIFTRPDAPERAASISWPTQ